MPYKQQGVQERVSALAVCMGSSAKSGQVASQLVVHTFNELRVRFAHTVLLGSNDALVGLVCVSAVANVLGFRQLLLKHSCRLRISVAQRKAHYLAAASVDCPPQPDGVFFDPT